MLTSEKIIIWEESSNRQIQKYVFSHGPVLSDFEKLGKLCIQKATVFRENCPPSYRLCLFCTAKKKKFSSPSSYDKKAPRLLPCRQTKRILHHGSERYYAEAIWPWNEKKLFLKMVLHSITSK